MMDPQVPFVLNTTGGTQPEKLAADQGNKPRYRKDAIRVGHFIARNPIDGSDLKLDVTPERLQQWAERFNQMRKNGVRVDLTVDHKRGAEAVRGDVTGMRLDGDRLLFDAEPADQESETLLQRCPEVSVEIDPDARDGQGNRYGEAIKAISVCRNAVVTDQQPFQRIAASQDPSRSAGDFALWFAPQSGGDPKENSNTGSHALFTDEQKKQVRQKLGLDENATDEKLATGILSALDQAAEASQADKKLQELSQKVGVTVDLSQQDQTLATAIEKVGERRARF